MTDRKRTAGAPDEPAGPPAAKAGPAPAGAADPTEGAAAGAAGSALPRTPEDPAHHRHQVAVLGAHLGGAMLAAVLARSGVDVVLVDAPADRTTPAGEDTVPYTAEVLELLARRFDVPELSRLGHFRELPEEVRATSGVKSSIGFVYARPGAPVRPRQVVQFNVPSEHGEAHLYRPDMEAHVHEIAVRHGARVPRGRAPLAGVRGRAGDFTVVLADGSTVGARFVVDMAGPDAPMLDHLGEGPHLRPLRHTTRVLTAHLRGVRPLEQRVDPGPGGTPWTGGTTLVVFPGGWLQLVPFGEVRDSAHTLTSVALSLDPKQWPQQDATPEEDFRRVVARFPDLAWQFERATALGEGWHGGEGGQYAAVRTAGEGFLLLDRSAVRSDFVLARDFTLTCELVHEAAVAILAADRTGDWSPAAFRGVESFQKSLVEHGESLVQAALAATEDFRLWNAFCRVWLLHSMFAALSLKRARNDALALTSETRWAQLSHYRGNGFWFPVYHGFHALYEDTSRVLHQVAEGRIPPGAAADRIFGQLRTAAFIPPLFGFADPDDRYYNFTPLKRFKVLYWAKRLAPPQVRRVLTRGATIQPSTER
ncbi:hypothetical protein [Streptomyces sp. NPDC089919]|uniref:FAD-dependent oxidoreductase n=1 Tax=Streptomyces sp. NPDC089919 TaxID=3155188 RepID=UPI003434409B